MNTMIESFGGKVTTALSGKTNCVIYGEEPGRKRLEDTKKRGIPMIDRFTFHRILTGMVELPSWASDDKQLPALEKYFKPTGIKYEC